MNRTMSVSSSSITVRNLDRTIKERLRVRAAEHGHSMEAEARQILQAALDQQHKPVPHLYDRTRARLADCGGGVELELPLREPVRDPPDLG